MYPFKINVYDADLIKIFKQLSRTRAAKIPSHNVAIKLGIKLKPIRKDIFLGTDNRYYNSFIALPPELELDFKEEKKRFQAIFKSIFS